MLKMLKLKLTLKTSLSIGGYTYSLFFDKATARDEEGISLIPGTAIKGALRIEFERLFGEAKANEIFGNNSKESILRFEDAKLVGKARGIYLDELLSKSFGYSSRIGVTISRKLKTAKEEALFHFQTTAPFLENLTFETYVSNFEKLPIVDQNDFKDKFLNILKKTGIFIGGDRTRGCGYFTLEFEQLEENHQKEKSGKVEESLKTNYLISLIPKEKFRVSFLKPKEYLYGTMEYIPGSSVRGAFAKEWIKKFSVNDEFRDVFLKGGVSFSHLYPSMGRVISKPIPLSARTCKVYPGLEPIFPKDPWKEAETHGAKDTLIDTWIVKNIINIIEKGSRKLNSNLISKIEKCEFCGKDLETIEGFYIWPCGEHPTKISVPTHYETKLKLDRRIMTAEEGKLYSYEVLERKRSRGGRLEDVVFTGLLEIKDEKIKNKFFEISELYIGGGRSRGFGKMKVEITTNQKNNGIEQRLNLFNKKLKEHIEFYEKELQIELLKKEKTYFSLDLLSDVILPFGESLYSLIEKKIGGTTLESGFVKKSFAGGYNSAIQIPKELRQIIVKGSVLLLSVEIKEGLQGLIDKLQEIEKIGLGLKREEGYGKVLFCDSFHLKFKQTQKEVQ